MRSGVKSKKPEFVPANVTLRDVLGSYDPTLPLTPTQSGPTLKDAILMQSQPKTSSAKKSEPKFTDPRIIAKLKPDSVPKKKEEKKEEAVVTPAEEKSSFDLNRLGLILSGGLSSLGAGIAGADQTRANQIAMANLSAYDQEKDNQKYEDPNSEESKQARSLFGQLYGGRVKMPENMTAAQFRAQSPVFDKILQRRMMELRPVGPKQPSTPKISESSEKNLRLAKQLQNDYAELAKLQREVGNETFNTPERQKMNLLKNRIIEAESVLSGQGALEQGIRDTKTGLLDVATFESRDKAAKRNEDAGRLYYESEAKNLADQTGMDLDQDPKTGKLYLVDPATGQRVRAL